MSKAIRYIECAHCGETVGSYLRHLPLLRVPAGGREASRNGRPAMVKDLLDTPPDLVEIAEALDAMAKPHYGSACKLIAESEGEQCTTERQEAIWMAYNGITRGKD